MLHQRLWAGGCLLAALLVTVSVVRSDEADAVKVIEKAGGTLRIDDKQPARPVTTVIMWGPGFKADLLKELRDFKSLTKLRIGGPWINDEAIKDLKVLTKLELLEIRSPRVTDAALKDLQEALPKLKITRASPGTGEIK